MKLKLSVAAIAVIAPLAAQATVVVDALTSHVGFGSLVLTTNASAGQAFKTPDATNVVLKDFSLLLRKDSVGSFFYSFKIHEWSGLPGRTIVGSELFSSGGHVLPQNAGVWNTVTFTTNLNLDPTKRYIAFVTNVGEPASANAAFIGTQANSNADGDSSLNGHWTTNPAYTSSIWMDIGTTDTAFRATFEPVPEPATLATLAAAGLLTIRKRRKKA